MILDRADPKIGNVIVSSRLEHDMVRSCSVAGVPCSRPYAQKVLGRAGGVMRRNADTIAGPRSSVAPGCRFCPGDSKFSSLRTSQECGSSTAQGRKRLVL